MTIHTYAILKDYFDKEFIIDETVDSVASLNTVLSNRNPAAKDILAACRFAVKDNFVSADYPLQAGDIIHIIPPSSGG